MKRLRLILGRLEEIILQKDTRNISKLKQFLSPDFLSESAELTLKHKGTIFIVTGFYIVYANASETDGPPGAVALGNALKSLGYQVVYITDEWSLKVVKSLVRDDILIDFPVTNHEESKVFSAKLISEYSPSMIVSIERASLVNDGTYRNWKGKDISDYNAKIDYLFHDIDFSIGIGDGGNEIGMGNLRNQIKEIEGLPDDPSITATTKLIVSSCSNWGAYGLIAAISLLIGSNLLIDKEQAKDLIRKTVDAGAVEGFTGISTYGVDGRDLEEDSVCLKDLNNYLSSLGL